MERKEIFEKLETIVAAAVNHHDFTLEDSTIPADIDKWDSLVNAMVITAIQQEFNIKLKFVEFMGWESFGQLVDLIENKLA